MAPGRYRERPYVPARDPLNAVPPSRHPFQFWMMFALTVSGAGNFFTPGSEILQRGLDPFFHKTWALTLMVSGMLCLIAAWWPDRATGLLMERIGMVTVGISCPVYAVVVAQATGWETSIVATALTTSAGVASAWRAVHVTRELKLLRMFMTRNFR